MTFLSQTKVCANLPFLDERGFISSYEYLILCSALFQSQLFHSVVKNRCYAIGRPWIYTMDHQVIFVMLKIVSAEVARKQVSTGIRVTKQSLPS